MTEEAKRGVIEPWNAAGLVQRKVADILRAEPWFKTHRVEIIEQDSQRLAFLLKTRLDQLKGVSLVVGVDGMSNDHPALEMLVTVSATERVTLNRATQGFVTALQAAQAAVHLIDTAPSDGTQQVWHFKDLRHESVRELDVFKATATFGGLVSRRTLLNHD